MDFAHEEPAGREAFYEVVEPGCVCVEARARGGDAVDDSCAIRIGLQAADAP